MSSTTATVMMMVRLRPAKRERRPERRERRRGRRGWSGCGRMGREPTGHPLWPGRHSGRYGQAATPRMGGRVEVSGGELLAGRHRPGERVVVAIGARMAAVVHKPAGLA